MSWGGASRARRSPARSRRPSRRRRTRQSRRGTTRRPIPRRTRRRRSRLTSSVSVVSTLRSPRAEAGTTSRRHLRSAAAVDAARASDGGGFARADDATPSFSSSSSSAPFAGAAVAPDLLGALSRRSRRMNSRSGDRFDPPPTSRPTSGSPVPPIPAPSAHRTVRWAFSRDVRALAQTCLHVTRVRLTSGAS